MREERNFCQRCNVEDEDLRTLWMACCYEMHELNIPFKKVEIDENHFYTLQVCKDCRAFWMGMIKVWFDNPPERQDSCGSGIFIRELGAVREITREEWDKREALKESVS